MGSTKLFNQKRSIYKSYLGVAGIDLLNNWKCYSTLNNIAELVQGTKENDHKGILYILKFCH